MLSILIMVLGVLAVFSWGIVVISAIRIVRLAPKGKGLNVYGKLGWWNFDAVRSITGPSVNPHIQTYQRAFIAFFVCVVVAMIAGTLLGAAAQN